MPETLDDTTRGVLGAYLRELRSLPNQAAKREPPGAMHGRGLHGCVILRGAQFLLP